jgi:hypothetical protein
MRQETHERGRGWKNWSSQNLFYKIVELPRFLFFYSLLNLAFLKKFYF